MKEIKLLLKKYKNFILYVGFGIITTAINIILYWLLYNILDVSNVPSNIIAWIGAVIFAFLTNKNLVFGSSSWDKKTVINELWKFFGARLATGGIDLLIMFLFVDVWGFNGMIIKIIANIIVIILNFVLSKLVVFRKKETEN